MLTKGIVEEIISPYSIRVRVPVYDGMSYGVRSTPTNELGVAVVCCIPKSHYNLQVNDVVIVGFEDNDVSKPIILGMLYCENNSPTTIDMSVGGIEISNSASLPEDTSIGEISPLEISYLKGVNGNIQEQLKLLSDRINNIERSVIEDDVTNNQ